MRHHRLPPALFLIAAALSVLMAGIAWSGQRVGLTVAIDAPVADDLYIAARHVDVLADVDGDVAAAGERVVVRSRVSGDVMAAGRSVLLAGRVEDDVRMAGARLAITGPVGDHVVAAGGNIRVGPAATIGGWAWFAGDSVRIDGEVDGATKVAAREIIVTGTLDGDAELTGERIEIRADAHLKGNLTWRGEHAPAVSDAARIDGRIIEAPAATGVDKLEPPVSRPGLFGLLLPLLSLIVAGIVVYLLFPRFSVQSAGTAYGEPLKSLGLGLAVLAATPIVVIALLVTAVGLLLAFVLLALYLVTVLFGYLTGAFSLSEGMLRLTGHQAKAGKGLRVVGIVVALVVLGVVSLIPYVGGLLVFVVLLLGLGALSLNAFRTYRR